MTRRNLVRVSIGACALAAICALTRSADAIDPPPAPLVAAMPAIGQASKVPPVEEIVARNAAARGGLDAWRAIGSMSEFGHMETGMIDDSAKRSAAKHAALAPREKQVPFTLHMKRPNKFQLQVEYQGATAIQTFDGTHGWTIMPSPSGPVAMPFPPGEAQAASTQLALDGPLIDSKTKGIKVAFERTDRVEGRETYRLMLTLRDGQVRRLWVDAQTFLDTKINGTRIIGGKAWPVETYFSAYKKVHGLVIPHALDTAVVGVRTTQRIIVDRVVLNPVIEDARFVPELPERTAGIAP